jgi:hypothetical protein
MPLMRCQTVAVSALPHVLTRARRPPVLDAARTALIPLRPLTIGEILDGGFLIVRRNIRLMIGLPLVVAGGTAAYVLAGVGLWVLLGNTTSRSAQIVLAVVMGVLGLLILQQFLVWLTAILSRVSLQTVLGEGFAPATTKATWRGSLPMFWPVLGLSLLQGVAVGVVQSALTLLYYAVGIGVLLAGVQDETLATAGLLVLTAVTYAVSVVLYGYLSLTVPALATESKNAPGWIGKPARPTNPVTAFERSVRLIGRRNLVRVGLIYGGLVLICLAVITLVCGGLLVMIALYAHAVNADVGAVLSAGWTIFGVVSFSALLAMSALLAYLAAVQTLVYLDLRMRREGLDLAMRFDCVPIPQPAAPPPPTYFVPSPPPPAMRPGPST